MSAIRVSLVEDHASLRQALAAVIGITDGMELAQEHDRADIDVVSLSAVTDVAVVDLDLPGGDGATLVEQLRGTEDPPACIILTGLTEDRELGRTIEAGASAVLHKATPIPELLDVIRAVAEGGTVLPAEETSRRLRALAQDREVRWEGRLLDERLTKREKEILQELVHGRSNDTIAERLHISPETVQTHVRNLMGKMGATTRLEAVSLGLQHELVTPP